MRHAIAAAFFLFTYFTAPFHLDIGAQPACADVGSVAPILDTSELLEHNGKNGMWFPLPTARRLLKDLKMGMGAIRLGSKLELRLEAEITKNKLLEDQLASVFREAQIWKDAAEARAKELADIVNPPWYKHPYAWAIFGFVIGTSTTTLIALAIGK